MAVITPGLQYRSPSLFITPWSTINHHRSMFVYRFHSRRRRLPSITSRHMAVPSMLSPPLHFRHHYFQRGNTAIGQPSFVIITPIIWRDIIICAIITLNTPIGSSSFRALPVIFHAIIVAHCLLIREGHVRSLPLLLSH